MKRFLLTIVAVAAILGFKFYNRNSLSHEIHDSVAKVVLKIPGYESDKAYFDKLFDDAHDVAFSAAFHMGGRHQSDRFERATYAQTLFSTMATRANAEKHETAGKFLEQVATAVKSDPDLFTPKES